MTTEYKPIRVPNSPTGLTDKQRDRLRIDMAHGINYLGESVKEINGKVQSHNIEIYGDKEYEGLKSMTHSNSKLIGWIVKILITLGIVGGAGLGIANSIGGI